MRAGANGAHARRAGAVHLGGEGVGAECKRDGANDARLGMAGDDVGDLEVELVVDLEAPPPHLVEVCMLEKGKDKTGTEGKRREGRGKRTTWRY